MKTKLHSPVLPSAVGESSIGHVAFVPPSTIRFDILSPKPGGAAYREVSLAEYKLPETPFTSAPIDLSSRPDMVEAIIGAIRSYVARNGYGHRTLHPLRGLIATLAKFFEYLWMQGCYRLSDCTPAHIEQLPAKLAQGGWAAALDVQRRTREFIQRIPPEALHSFVATSKRGHGYHLKKGLAQQIGTNVAGVERVHMREIVLEELSLPVEYRAAPKRLAPSAVAGMSVHGLRRDFDIINQLADSPGTPVLNFVPIARTSRTIKQLGRPGGRTDSIRPPDVGQLLREAFKNIDQVAPPLIQLLNDAHGYLLSECIARGKQINHKTRPKALQSAIERSSLPGLTGLSILPHFKHIAPNLHEISVGQLVRDVMSACFIVIATLNGRRKGEVESPIYGLTDGSLRVLDHQLGVYECNFYIEKTYQDYLPFYVGDATVRAIRVLEALSSQARVFLELADPKRDYVSQLQERKPLFLMPYIKASGAKNGPLWFEFSSAESGASRNFIKAAFNGKGPQIAAHMLRRAYALLFFYRYEDGDLIALKQQLAHFDIEMTRVYVTWGAAKALGVTLEDYGSLTKEQVQALQTEHRDLIQELEKISTERIREFVESILSESRSLTGNFTKLIQRFHQKLGAQVVYRFKKDWEQKEVMTEFLANRGHVVTPFPHGNCVVAPAKRSRAAGCYSRVEGRILRENAAPHVCGSCPYHVLTKSHVELMTQDAREMENKLARMSPDTVIARHSARVLQNLRRWIELHTTRLADNPATK